MPYDEWRSCGKKIRHATREDAQRHRLMLVKSGTAESRVRIYRCPFCGSFHVGKGPKPRRNRR